MSRIVWIAGGALALTALIASHGSSSSIPAPVGTCDVWTHEPLVAYDITGATFAGPYDESLHVYNDGTVKHFSAVHGKGTVAFVQPQEATKLARDLFFAGAFTLCDDPAVGNDIPMKTLTLFRGSPDAVTHTVNWFISDAPYGTLEQILNAFIATHIP